MSFPLEHTLRQLTRPAPGELSTVYGENGLRHNLPVLGQALADSYEAHLKEIRRRHNIVAWHAKTESQRLLSLHDYWLDKYEDFSRFKVHIEQDLEPMKKNITHMNQQLLDITNKIGKLEDTLVVLLEQKEIQIQQEFQKKKETELAQQRNKYIQSYRDQENKYISQHVSLTKAVMEKQLAEKQQQLQLEFQQHFQAVKNAVPRPAVVQTLNHVNTDNENNTNVTLNKNDSGSTEVVTSETSGAANTTQSAASPSTTDSSVVATPTEPSDTNDSSSSSSAAAPASSTPDQTNEDETSNETENKPTPKKQNNNNKKNKNKK